VKDLDNLITIENENLANYIMFKLDKLENKFSEEELNQITEVVIDYNEEDESSFLFLNELLKLKKLQSITIRNAFIYNDNYRVFLNLNNLNELVFDNCKFEYADLVALLKLKSLSLINCKIDNYSFVNVFENLEKLTITNGKIEIKKLNKLKHLKYLEISYSNILDENELDISSLEELYIDNTNINNFDFLKKLDNLKKVSIDEKQYNNNKSLFNSLINNNILVMNENMVYFGGEDDE
jgi:hypothetical protein